MDPAAAFLAAAREAFATLTAAHLSPQQRQAAKGAEARIIIDIAAGRIRAALVLPGGGNPISVLDVIAGTGTRAAA